MSLRSDAFYCALHILDDLLEGAPRTLLRDPLLLCEIHGGRPLIDRTLKPSDSPYCTGEEIVLAPGCTLAQYSETIPHELTHRLADTPRWAWLNDHIQGWKYNREEFIEAVATFVGRVYSTLCLLALTWWPERAPALPT